VRATKAATDAATEVRTPSGWAAKTPRTDVSPAATEGIAAPNIARLQKKLGGRPYPTWLEPKWIRNDYDYI